MCGSEFFFAQVDDVAFFVVNFLTHIIRDSLIGRKGNIYQPDAKRDGITEMEKKIFPFSNFQPDLRADSIFRSFFPDRSTTFAAYLVE